MEKFTKFILTWYSKHARDLPWRNQPDPYAIWVSEVMLQQTQVSAVIPYFTRWMKRFPDILTLSQASEGDVLSMWEGLGYYARARNLSKASRVVMRDYRGVLPADMNELRKIPGIGRYTAAAIASMAFGADEVALDGNIKRVISRVFNIRIPVNTNNGEKTLLVLASRYLPAGRAGDYNQALMDIGATICLPKNPECGICPVKNICEAWNKNLQGSLPVLIRKPIPPTLVKAAAVVKRGRKVLIIQRQSNGLLGGMWEFPSAQVKGNPSAELSSVINSTYKLKVTSSKYLDTINHAFTHFKLTEHVFLCTLKKETKLLPGFRWISIDELSNYPMGKVDRRIANKINIENG
jgi:A/G-specific adenine glycosylase